MCVCVVCLFASSILFFTLESESSDFKVLMYGWGDHNNWRSHIVWFVFEDEESINKQSGSSYMYTCNLWFHWIIKSLWNIGEMSSFSLITFRELLKLRCFSAPNWLRYNHQKTGVGKKMNKICKTISQIILIYFMQPILLPCTPVMGLFVSFKYYGLNFLT